MPRALEAAAAESSFEVSEFTTVVASVSAGTLMVATITLPGRAVSSLRPRLIKASFFISMVTAWAATPARSATVVFMETVSTVPVALSVSVTLSFGIGCSDSGSEVASGDGVQKPQVAGQFRLKSACLHLVSFSRNVTSGQYPESLSLHDVGSGDGCSGGASGDGVQKPQVTGQFRLKSACLHLVSFSTNVTSGQDSESLSLHDIGSGDGGGDDGGGDEGDGGGGDGDGDDGGGGMGGVQRGAHSFLHARSSGC
eukprot:scaffold48508_cov53-Phaeocystis_antarctica.AAC.1